VRVVHRSVRSASSKYPKACHNCQNAACRGSSWPVGISSEASGSSEGGIVILLSQHHFSIIIFLKLNGCCTVDGNSPFIGVVVEGNGNSICIFKCASRFLVCWAVSSISPMQEEALPYPIKR